MLKNTFVNRDAQIWIKLYTCYVRPHLEFAIPVWSPYMQKDINRLEKVQRRATKLIHKLRSNTYDERCRTLGIQQLIDRRIRGDLIQMFKINKKFDEIIWHYKPLIIESNRGGRRPQIRREIVRCCNQRHHFFSNRTANAWNMLPDHIVNSKTVNEFKNRLDKFTAIGRLTPSAC